MTVALLCLSANRLPALVSVLAPLVLTTFHVSHRELWTNHIKVCCSSYYMCVFVQVEIMGST